MVKIMQVGKIFYALFDNQVDEIKHIGLNENSLDKLRIYFQNFLLDGCFSDEGEQSIRENSLDELLNYYEFTLLKSSVPFVI